MKTPAPFPKKSCFDLLDWDLVKHPSNLLDPLGWFNLTAISETLHLFAFVPEDEADELAYEWATQPKYSKYLEPLG